MKSRPTSDDFLMEFLFSSMNIYKNPLHLLLRDTFREFSSTSRRLWPPFRLPCKEIITFRSLCKSHDVLIYIIRIHILHKIVF